MFDLRTHLKGNWIVFSDDSKVTSTDFSCLICGAINELTKISSQRIAIQNSDPISFMAWFLAGLTVGKEVFLISDFLSDNLLQETLSNYQIEYLCPNERIISHDTFELNINTLDSRFFIFTSGSTGEPKAICHNFANIQNASSAFNQFFCLDSTSWVHSLPCYHVSGLMAFFRCFLAKYTYSLEKLDRTKASCVSLVPSQLLNLLKNGEIATLKKFDLILLGGQELASSLFQAAIKHGIKISYSFGMTETMALVCATEIGCFSQDNGRMLPGRKAKIIDEKLAIKSESNFLYYLQGEKKVDGPTPSDYFITSDLASIENDRVRIWGRADDVFQVNGENINPYLIENYLCQLDYIEQAVVVPRVNAEGMIEICAFVEVFGSFDRSRTIDFILQKLGSLFVPKHFFELNESFAGGIKIRRHELFELVKSFDQSQEL